MQMQLHLPAGRLALMESDRAEQRPAMTMLFGEPQVLRTTMDLPQPLGPMIQEKGAKGPNIACSR